MYIQLHLCLCSRNVEATLNMQQLMISSVRGYESFPHIYSAHYNSVPSALCKQGGVSRNLCSAMCPRC